MSSVEYDLWLVMHEFPQFDFEKVRNMSIEQLNFLTRGLARYYGKGSKNV